MNSDKSRISTQTKVSVLRRMAKTQGVRHYDKMSKQELVKRVKLHQTGSVFPAMRDMFSERVLKTEHLRAILKYLQLNKQWYKSFVVAGDVIKFFSATKILGILVVYRKDRVRPAHLPFVQFAFYRPNTTREVYYEGSASFDAYCKSGAAPGNVWSAMQAVYAGTWKAPQKPLKSDSCAV